MAGRKEDWRVFKTIGFLAFSLTICAYPSPRLMTHVPNSSLLYPTRLSYIFMSLPDVIIKRKKQSGMSLINPAWTRTPHADCQLLPFLQPICVTYRQDQETSPSWITHFVFSCVFSFRCCCEGMGELNETRRRLTPDACKAVRSSIKINPLIQNNPFIRFLFHSCCVLDFFLFAA